jgi:hypothetical protein
MVNPDGETAGKRWLQGEKTLWWSENFTLPDQLEPNLTVTARRLDGPAPTVEAESPGTNGSHPVWETSCSLALNFPSQDAGS